MKILLQKTQFRILILLVSILPSGYLLANFQLQNITKQLDSISFDSTVLITKGDLTECIHSNGYKVIFKGGRKFNGLIFIDSSDDTLAINTDGIYPIIKYQKIEKSLLVEAVNNNQKKTTINSTVTSKYGNYIVTSHFSNSSVDRIEVNNGNIKYTFEFYKLRKHTLSNLFGEQSNKAVVGYSFYKKCNTSYSLYHKSKPTSVSVNFKGNGEVKSIFKVEYDTDGLPIKEYIISVK